MHITPNTYQTCLTRINGQSILLSTLIKRAVHSTDNEEELSDVGSLASAHNARLPPSAHVGLPLQVTHATTGNIGSGISAAHRRALGQKKTVQEGEGSQSDSVDSPV